MNDAQDASSARLVQLDADHPGFRDLQYRRRRDAIARLALEHVRGDPPPEVQYTREEHAVWRTVLERLVPLHGRLLCSPLVELQREVALDPERIPQFGEVGRRTGVATGFRLEPVAGLVGARDFLVSLGHGVFLATQYVRHGSRPFYTPEPDVIHELVGHAASLMHPGIAHLNRLFGRAARRSSAREMEAIERVYWYTLEFGLVAEGDRVKALGAGLLSSCAELEGVEAGPDLLDWDLRRIASTPYDPTCLQPRLFVAPSFERLVGDVARWLLSCSWW